MRINYEQEITYLTWELDIQSNNHAQMHSNSLKKYILKLTRFICHLLLINKLVLVLNNNNNIIIIIILIM